VRKKHALVFSLPLPPEGAALGDSEFRGWLARAGAEIAKDCTTDLLAGDVAVKAFVSLGETQRVEKIAARLIDVLVVLGVIAEGSVCDLAMRRDRTIAEGRVRLEVKQTIPPAERLGADARANVARSARARWANYRAEKAA
jgi:hypothetical protein